MNYEVTTDIMKMSVSELKNKLIHLAEAYKTERLRNIEFDEQIRIAYKDVDIIPELDT